MYENDQFSIVSFEHGVQTITKKTIMDPESRSELIKAVRRTQPGGNTNLSEGWLTCCNRLTEGLDLQKINWVLLLSDGQSNESLTGIRELSRQVEEMTERGITTSTFGIGLGFNNHVMEAIANHGGGNFYFVELAGSIQFFLRKEFTNLGNISARNVILEINFPDGVNASLPGDWKSKTMENKVIVYLSGIPANHTTSIPEPAYPSWKKTTCNQRGSYLPGRE